MPIIELAESLPKPVAYVLAGGAAFGAVQAGHLRALGATDIKPDFVVGTSVGSLNGAVVAEEPDAASERLDELWATVSRDEIFGNVISTALNIATRKPSTANDAGLRAMIQRSLHSTVFSDLEIPLTAVTTDFDTGQAVLLTEGDLTSALCASAAIPLVFPPVLRGDRTLVDGGLVANVPIGIAAAKGAKTIVVLDCGFTVMPAQRDDNITGKLWRMGAIMASQQVRRDLEQIDGQTVLYLPGPWPIRSRPDDFGKSAELAATTYGLTLAWLQGLTLDGPGRYGASPADALAKKVALKTAAEHEEELAKATEQEEELTKAAEREEELAKVGEQ